MNDLPIKKYVNSNSKLGRGSFLLNKLMTLVLCLYVGTA